MNIEQALGLLGYRVSDKVTGFGGVATSICFDLYGCVQCAVHPGMKADGTMGDALWLDVDRLKTNSADPVMKQPTFTRAVEKGPAEKPRAKS